MNARYYVPGVGRFASADTIVPDPTRPQAWNRYTYGYNDPIKLVDPSGHCAGEPNGIEDKECWQYAQLLSIDLGLTIEFLGLLNLEQLNFFDSSLNSLGELNPTLPDAIVEQINTTQADFNFLKYVHENSDWDVLGARVIDGSASGLLGINSSLDTIFNFNSLELSVFFNLNGTIGAQGGADIGSGIFLGFNSPNNDIYRGWGHGATLGATFGTGATVQFETAKQKGNWTMEKGDQWSITLLYNFGAEASVSYGVGYSWELSTHNFKTGMGCIFGWCY